MDNLKDATSGAGTVIPLGTPLFLVGVCDSLF